MSTAGSHQNSNPRSRRRGWSQVSQRPRRASPDRVHRVAAVRDVHAGKVGARLPRERLHVRAVLAEERGPVADPVGRCVPRSDRRLQGGPRRGAPRARPPSRRGPRSGPRSARRTARGLRSSLRPAARARGSARRTRAAGRRPVAPDPSRVSSSVESATTTSAPGRAAERVQAAAEVREPVHRGHHDRELEAHAHRPRSTCTWPTASPAAHAMSKVKISGSASTTRAR